MIEPVSTFYPVALAHHLMSRARAAAPTDPAASVGRPKHDTPSGPSPTFEVTHLEALRAGLRAQLVWATDLASSLGRNARPSAEPSDRPAYDDGSPQNREDGRDIRAGSLDMLV